MTQLAAQSNFCVLKGGQMETLFVLFEKPTYLATSIEYTS